MDGWMYGCVDVRVTRLYVNMLSCGEVGSNNNDDNNNNKNNSKNINSNNNNTKE